MTTGLRPVQLGLGLIRLGRSWGVPEKPALTEAESRRLLEVALEAGITFLDTAPAYGDSEVILGRFLSDLSEDAKKRLTIATKCGEFWEDGNVRTDHSYEALKMSIDRSFERLGSLNILQIHRATVEALGHEDTFRALDYARSSGIREVGASVSSKEALDVGLASQMLQWMQFPVNASDLHFGWARLCGESNVKVIANRPFEMGATAKNASEMLVSLKKVVDTVAVAGGVVLTGTANVDHLRSNAEAFQEVSLQA